MTAIFNGGHTISGRIVLPDTYADIWITEPDPERHRSYLLQSVLYPPKADNYDILITFSGNYNVGTLDPACFTSIGLSADNFTQGGSYLIRNGSFVYSSAPAETYYRSLQSGSTPVTFFRKEPASEAVTDAGGGYNGQNINDGLYIGTENHAFTVNGVNLVIYDPELKLVIDSIGVNVYDGKAVLRKDNSAEN